MEENPYESPSSVKPTEPRPSGRSRIDGQELFGVLVRAIGLYFILYGMIYAIRAFFYFGGLAHSEGFDRWMAARDAVEWLTPGVISFFFSKNIVRIAYSGDHEEQSEES